MRSGLSSKFLATLFNVSKSSIRRTLSTVRKALMTTFVPDNIGFDHVSRSSVMTDHTRPLAQSHLGDFGQLKAILVLDGTYTMYIHRKNWKLQLPASLIQCSQGTAFGKTDGHNNYVGIFHFNIRTLFGRWEKQWCLNSKPHS